MQPLIFHYELSDNDLAELTCEGCIKAMKRLIGRHQQAIYMLALNWCGDAHMAAAFTRKILIKMLSLLAARKLEKDFSPWFQVLLSNELTNLPKNITNEHEYREFDIAESVVSIFEIDPEIKKLLYIA